MAGNKESHDKALRALFARFSELGLTINQSKCKFNQNEITFWGMRFTPKGITPDLIKVETLHYASRSRNKDELRSFLGMSQANSDFIS